MSALDTISQVIITASTTVVAVTIIGIYRLVSSFVATVESHDRTLYGQTGVDDGWDGLVARVADHEAELHEARDDAVEPNDAATDADR